MIPASQLNPYAVGQMVQYLKTELAQAKNDRSLLESRWNRFLAAYRALPETEVKKFPFEGAANLVLPVIATDVDTVYSRLMGLLFAADNFWSMRAQTPEALAYAPRVQEFMQWAQDAELGVYDAAADFLLELCKLGTGVIKTRYTRESKRVYQFRETDQGTVERIMQMLVKDHPVIQHVSLFDFFIPASACDIQYAPWCAERIHLTYQQYRNRVAAGIYQDIGLLPNSGNDRGPIGQQIMQQLDAYQPAKPDQMDFMECWLDYDVSGVGEPIAVVATIHETTGRLARVDFNPFFDQEKPYDFARYLRQEKRFYGIGLCEMLDQFQDEISTMHNQRLDNATLANSSMFKARKGIGIRQDEPVFPGRWFLLDNMEDVQPMSMGQRYDSTTGNEELTVSYARGRTGVTDYISGADNPSIGYGTATTAVQMLREGTKRFDQVLRECRRCFGSVGRRALELYQQFNQNGKEYLAMGQQDGAVVHMVLQFPLELIRTSIGVELTATSANLNKEVQIRTNQLVMQMMMQFYQQLMMGASYLVNPQVPPLIKQLAGEMLQGGTILMRRILDDYGIQDADMLVPTLGGAIQSGNQQLSTLANLASGGQGGYPAAGGSSGMAVAQGNMGAGGPPQLASSVGNSVGY